MGEKVEKSIEERLLELSDSYKEKIELDFNWEQRDGLKHTSEKSLELAYLIILKGKLNIEYKDKKIILLNNIMNFCDKKATTEEAIEIMKKEKNLNTNQRTFKVNEGLSVNRICTDCKYQKCPKRLAAYILYLICKNQLKEKLEERRKYRKDRELLSDKFSFEWKYGNILKKVPDDVYEFANNIVDKGYVYVDRFLDDNETCVNIYLPFSCKDLKLMFENLDNIYSDKTDIRTWSMLKRNYNSEIGLCNQYACGLQGCVIALAGIIYYLKEIGREDIIENDRKYYLNNRKEMDQELLSIVEEQEKNKKEKEEKFLKNIKKYESKIDRFNEFLDALENPNQKNLHCILEGEDFFEKGKLINSIKEYLYIKEKIKEDKYERISLNNLAARNAYSYAEILKDKFDKKGTQCRIQDATNYTELDEQKLYVIDNLKEFIRDYKNLDRKYSMLKYKQYHHVLELLSDTFSSNYIILDGTQEEIDEILRLSLKIQYIYQNYRFKFKEFDLEESFRVYLKNLDNDIFDKIKDKEYEYKKNFIEYISLNKNFIPFSNREIGAYLAMYSNSKNDAILPPNIYKKETTDEALKNIIGLENVKKKVKEFEKYMLFKVQAESNGIKLGSTNMHMIFTGNPGTGKTTIARIMAKMLFDMGIIKENKLIEVGRKDLVAGYVGQTAEKTAKVIEKSIGGVLFIDEAYSLANGNKNDFGYEAIATLIKAMEDHKDKLVVIFAGYKDEMRGFLEMNSGISSRIGYVFDFNDYNIQELIDIFYKKITNMGFQCEEKCKNKISKIVKYFSQRKGFGNGRFVDKLIQEIILKHAINETDIDMIMEKDIPDIREFNNTEDNEESMEEILKEIIGMEELKTKIYEFEKFVKFIKKAEKENIKIPNQNMHMIFTGNPGTGKTTVARIMAKLLYNTGIIQENKLVEVERKDLIGRYIGETAIKTSDVIEKARGGILFIDEAYSLAEGGNNDFGGESIATLIKAMEDHKDDLIVIFAGYKKEMKNFLDMNSGILSRIGYTFDFPDYTREELSEILYRKIDRSNFKIDKIAKTKIMEIMNYFCNVENIGNGRFANKVFQEILLKHALNEGEINEITEKDIPTIQEITKSLFNGNNMINPENINEESLKKTAIHEIGHALVRYKLYSAPGIITITIRPEGSGTLGYVKHKISSSYVRNKTTLLNEVKVCLAGMASEEIFLGEFLNGNTSDLRKASLIVENMITRYGMSNLGYVYIENKSGDIASKVQDEAKSILDECYEETLKIIKENKEKIIELVDYLVDKKEITEEEFLNIVNSTNE